MRTALIIAAGTVLGLTLAGCGEKPAVTVYKQGQYQGKPDMRPWDNANFKGDKAAWEQQIKRRNDGQNEYARATPTAN